MKNPFSYFSIAEDEAFCNRAKEQDTLIKNAKTSQNLVLYAHRRMGKTSFIHQVIKRLEKARPKVQVIYIDLYGTVSEIDFIKTLYGGISRLEPNFNKLLKMLVGVRASFYIDPETNAPSVSVSMQPSEVQQYLEMAMKILTDYSKKRKLMVVFDEIQEVSKYENAVAFEKRLRSHIQLQNNICYVFSGSHRRIMTQMFSSADRAFYQMAGHMTLDPISKSDYLKWAKDLFKKGSRPLDEDIIFNIVDRCESQPMPIQQFLYELWDARQVGIGTVESIEQVILRSRKDTFMTIWDSLSVNHKKMLQLVARTDGKKVFALDNLVEAGIKSPSAAQKSLLYLVDHQILTKNGGYKFQDVMFKWWILRILKY